MAKRCHSDHEIINEELGLEFAQEELRGRKATKNKDVLLFLEVRWSWTDQNQRGSPNGCQICQSLLV